MASGIFSSLGAVSVASRANKPIGDTYSTVEFGVTKRMSDYWQLTSGFDWTKRNLSSQFSEDPNTVFCNSNNTQTTGWTFKASGSYVFNRGVLVSLFYNAMKGEPYGRLFTVTEQYLRLADPNRTTPLVQGNMTILADKIGTYYLPAINMINLRAQKEFVIKDAQRLHLMLNVFNLTGADAEKALEAAAKADLIVFVAGLTSRLEGEEMRVAAPGRCLTCASGRWSGCGR